MPYIAREARERMAEGDWPETAGELNYVVSTAVWRYLSRKGASYAAINEAVGVLECAKLELYRRVAAPYEDRKCEQHGDIY
jgi:hypothetical protein